MVKIPKSVSAYHVYAYEHVDELTFILAPSKVEKRCEYGAGIVALKPDISKLFRANGWEGDGDIGLLWLPPFVGPWGSCGQLVWFVKQDNNGTSFLASDRPLPYHDLQDEDEAETADPFEGMIPEGIVRVSHEGLDGRLGEIRAELDQNLTAVAALSQTSKVGEHLTERAQGQMVQALLGFLDDCYLRILIEVVRDGNRSKLKLRKAKANVNPASYHPEDFEGSDDGFFTLNGLISDLWASYKFEPFPTKIEMLLKPLDFTPDANLMFELRKHVALRNAVQHHDGRIGADLLSTVGRDHIPIVGPSGEARLEARSRIRFPVEEIQAFDNSLRNFASLLDTHVEGRISARLYSTPGAALSA